MNIYGLDGKSIEQKEGDGRLTKWLKNIQIKYGARVYGFDSLEEFESYSLNEHIKRRIGIIMHDIQVDSILHDPYGINLELRENAKSISFEKLKPGHLEDWGLKYACWLELNKLKQGDELEMLSFIYYHHSIYQLVDLKRKNNRGGDDNETFEVAPKNSGGQSIDDLIAEVFGKNIVEVFEKK